MTWWCSVSDDTEAFDAIVDDVGQPEALAMAIDIHVDMMAFISAGFTRAEAFEIMAHREAARIEYLYARQLHQDFNGDHDE